MTDPIGWGNYYSPWGLLVIRWTARGIKGLTRVSFREQLPSEHRSRVLPGPTPLPEALARDLYAYFAGEVVDWTRHPLDLEGLSPFTREVLRATSAIPQGCLSTYGELARQVQHPRAARAVGQALRKNPVLLLVPCHRVVGSKGCLGGFTGGLEQKVRLLRWEGHEVDAVRGRVFPSRIGVINAETPG